jgi:hypothetical protein
LQALCVVLLAAATAVAFDEDHGVAELAPGARRAVNHDSTQHAAAPPAKLRAEAGKPKTAVASDSSFGVSSKVKTTTTTSTVSKPCAKGFQTTTTTTTTTEGPCSDQPAASAEPISLLQDESEDTHKDAQAQESEDPGLLVQKRLFRHVRSHGLLGREGSQKKRQEKRGKDSKKAVRRDASGYKITGPAYAPFRPNMPQVTDAMKAAEVEDIVKAITPPYPEKMSAGEQAAEKQEKANALRIAKDLMTPSTYQIAPDKSKYMTLNDITWHDMPPVHEVRGSPAFKQKWGDHPWTPPALRL